MIVSNRLSDVDTSSCFSLLMYIKENKPKLPYEFGVYMYLTVYVHVLFQDRTPRENWIALKHCNWVLDFKTCLRKNTCTRHQTIGIKCRTFNTRERIEKSRFEFTFFFRWVWHCKYKWCVFVLLVRYLALVFNTSIQSHVIMIIYATSNTTF